MIPWLVAIGLISMLGQVVLLRELNVAFYGSELIYILALGLWMFWTAVGAGASRRAARLPSARNIRRLLLLFACLLPAVLAMVRGHRLLFGGVPGAYLSFPRQLLAMTLALLPVGLILGLLFQWAAKLYVGGRRTLARAYAIESAGALVGGVLATLLLRWGVRNFTACLLCAALAAAAAALHPPHRRRSILTFPALLAAGLLVVGWLLGPELDRRTTAWNHPRLVETADSPYGRITVTELQGQVSVFENDALAFESEGTAAEEFAHLAAIQREATGSVLILGGGVEGLVREMLPHRPRSVEYVELNRTLLDLLPLHLPGEIRDSFEAEGVDVTVDDPRTFLRGAGRYDLILIGMPQPESGQTNRFYTKEFFALCAIRLNPEGVLALRLRGAENLWTPLQSRRISSIHRALAAVFPEVVVLPGTTHLLFASSAPLVRDPDVLADRLEARGVEARLVVPPYVRYLYTNDRFGEIENLLRTTRAPTNTDGRPVCYSYTMLLWLSRFFPALGRVELPVLDASRVIFHPASWIAVVGLAGSFLLARRRSIVRRSLLAATAGLVGMVLETALILHYQTQRGVLFQDLGLLLTMFMGGLALGAATTDRWLRRFATGDVERSGPAVRGTGFVLVVALSGLGLLCALLFRSGVGSSLTAISALLLACGFLVAALFSFAALERFPDQRTVVSPVYAADLVGGCVGSLLAGLVLIPLTGMAGSSLLVGALTLLALLLV